MNPPQFFLGESPEVRAAEAAEQLNRSLRYHLDGRAAFDALVSAVEELSRTAPDNHDVLVLVGDLAVRKVRFDKPHTMTFEGFDSAGQRAWAIQHYTQLNARVIYRPHESGRSRVITGFAPVA